MKSKVVKLNKDTIIEVIAKKGNEVIKKEMTYHEALNIHRKKGWYYDFYQKGFSQYQITLKNE